MKKKLLAILSIPLLLSSCSFISIKENSVPQSEISIEALKSEKEKYIERLYEICDYDLYFSDTWHQLDLVRQECINRINEASDIASLKDIFDGCIEYIDANIESIKCYINRNIDEINIESLLENYLNAEQHLIDKRYKSLVNNIEQLKTKVEINSSINSFLSYVKTLKTKESYIEDFHNAMESYLNDNIFESEYYAEQIDEINSIISRYHSLLENVISYEELEFVFDEITHELSDVSLKADIDKKLIQETIASTIKTLTELGIGSSKIDSIKEEMEDEHNTFVDIMLIYIREYVSFAEENMLDEDEKVAIVKQLKINALQYLFLQSNVYSKEGLEQIESKLETWIGGLNNALSIDAINSTYDLALSDLGSVKTHVNEIQDSIDEFETIVTSLTGDKYLDGFKEFEANDYYELANIIDSYLFYQLADSTFIDDEFDVKINFPYHNATQLRNEAYWYTRLIRCAADMQFEENEGFIKITLTGYNQASRNAWEYNTPADHFDDLVAFSSESEKTPRSEDFEDFPYLSSGKPELLCWNSQQLWYAFEKGYLPIAKENSKAAVIIERAKEILKNIIKDGMTPEEKIFAIYSWFGQNVQFDTGVYRFNKSTDMDNYPAQELSQFNCFYPEGPLLDGLSVCSGYAKAYLILLSMEGFECRNALVKPAMYANINTINTGKNGIGHHEITYVKLDDHWFYSDAERANASEVSSFIQASWSHVLVPVDFQNYGKTVNDNGIELHDDYLPYIIEKLTVNGANIYVENKDDIKNLVDSVGELEPQHSFSILYNKAYVEAKNDFLKICSKYSYIELRRSKEIVELLISN